MSNYIGAINGVKTGAPSADPRGWVGLEKEHLYLFDAAIGTKVKFVADGVQKTGTIRRVNGKESGSAQVVRYLSVADDIETWVNDNGDCVPVTWTVNFCEFELSPQLNCENPADSGEDAILHRAS